MSDTHGAKPSDNPELSALPKVGIRCFSVVVGAAHSKQSDQAFAVVGIESIHKVGSTFVLSNCITRRICTFLGRAGADPRFGQSIAAFVVPTGGKYSARAFVARLIQFAA
jgi:hypothetical protein